MKYIIDNSNVMKDWDYEKNSEIDVKTTTSGSNKRAWFRCTECGHQRQSYIFSVANGHQCPSCAGNILKEGRSLGDLHPTLMKEWVFDDEINKKIDPYSIAPSSGEKVGWKCERGHVFYAQISNRTSRGDGCPYCSGRYVTPENNLAVLYPEVARNWHPTKNGNLTPYDILPNNNNKFWWICDDCGSEYETRASVRLTMKKCPYCSGKKINHTNSFFHTQPDKMVYKKRRKTHSSL